MSKRMSPGLNSTQYCCLILPLKTLMCIYSDVALICILLPKHLWEGANDVGVHLEEHSCLRLQIGVKYIRVIFCKSVSRIFKSSFLTFANSHLCHGNVNRYTYIDVHMYHIFQIFNSHLFHGNVDRSKPGSVHPEEADQVCPVVHHRDVHLGTIWWTF